MPELSRFLTLSLLGTALAFPGAALAFPCAVLADPPQEESATDSEGVSATGLENAGSSGPEERADSPAEEAAEGVPVLDLEALTAAATASYPGIEAAQARIAAAESQLEEAWVSPYFQSTITGGVSIAPEVRGNPIFSPDSQFPIGNPWQPILGLQIEGVIPLWTFGKLPAVRSAARAGVHAAESDENRVRAQVRYDIRRAYYALQLALDLRQMLDEGLPQLREAAEHLEAQLEAGSTDVSEMDRYRLAAALSEIEARQADAIRLEAGARAALVALTNINEFQIPPCPIAPLTTSLRPLQYYVDRGQSQRPEVHMLAAAVRAREASVDLAEANFFPDLAIGYRLGITYAPGITDQTNPFVIDQANYPNVQAGIVLRWNLDLWGNMHRVDRQSALLNDVRARSEEAQRGIGLEINQAYHAATAARSQVASWATGRRETRAWFVAAAQGGDLGTVEPRDMVDAARAYFQARFEHLSAIRAFNSALAELARASGTEITRTWEQVCE